MSVVTFGCSTRQWKKTLDLSNDVMSAIASDESLLRVLERAMVRHARRMPERIPFDGAHQTEVWKVRSGKLSCFITTWCSRSSGVTTLVNVAPSRRGRR